MGGFRLQTKKVGGGTGPSARVGDGNGTAEAKVEVANEEEQPVVPERPTPPAKPLPVATTTAGEVRQPWTSPRGPAKVSFQLPRSLHTRLKLESVRRGEPIVAMISRWIEENTPTL